MTGNWILTSIYASRHYPMHLSQFHHSLVDFEILCICTNQIDPEMKIKKQQFSFPFYSLKKFHTLQKLSTKNWSLSIHSLVLLYEKDTNNFSPLPRATLTHGNCDDDRWRHENDLYYLQIEKINIIAYFFYSLNMSE